MNFFYLLNIILISRLFFLFKDRPVNIGQTITHIHHPGCRIILFRNKFKLGNSFFNFAYGFGDIFHRGTKIEKSKFGKIYFSCRLLFNCRNRVFRFYRFEPESRSSGISHILISLFLSRQIF